MRLLSTQTIQLRSLSKITMANEVASYESNANEVAKDKNNGK